MKAIPTAAPPAAKRWNPWPWAIAGYFALVLTLIGFFVPFALRQNMDLVRKDYYEEEMRHQAQMLRVERTRPLLGAVAVELLAGEGKIRVRLPKGHAATAAGTIQLYRPSDARMDVVAPIGLDRGGEQLMDASKLTPGLWKARVTWSANGEDYYFEQVVVAPSKA